MSQRVVGTLGAAPEEVDVRGVVGLVEQDIGCVNAMFDVRLRAAADRVSARGEAGLVVLPATDLRDFLTAGPGHLPSVASLL